MIESRPRKLAGLVVSLVACSAPQGRRDAAATAPIAEAGVEQRDSAESLPEPDGAGAAFAPSAGCVHPDVTSACRDGLCRIPAGCFVMGTPRDARSAAAYSDQEIEVRLTHSFLVGQHEVTRAEWLGSGLPDPPIDWRRTGSSDANVPPPGYEQCLDPECPVLWVGFEDAAAYANLRSEMEGLAPCYVLAGCVGAAGMGMRCTSVRVDANSPYDCDGYRLPTEAEWEYAARAGTRTDYYSGDMGPETTRDGNCNLDLNLDRIAWYCGNSGAPEAAASGGRAQRVGQKEANGFGIHDMSGNAYEWVNDRFTPFGYGADPFGEGVGPRTDPVYGVPNPDELTPSAPVFPSSTDGLSEDGFPGYRVMRGGSFDLWPLLAASGYRLYFSVAGQHSGFRIARTLHPAPAKEAR